MNNKIQAIIDCCLTIHSTNPLELFLEIANKDFINMHGPEHHILDGACILTAYYNKSYAFNLLEALEKLASEGSKMPGAMCGKWGVCGAVTSIGAALAILDHTGPLSDDGTWGEHMTYSSKVIHAMGKSMDLDVVRGMGF